MQDQKCLRCQLHFLKVLCRGAVGIKPDSTVKVYEILVLES